MGVFLGKSFPAFASWLRDSRLAEGDRASAGRSIQRVGVFLAGRSSGLSRMWRGLNRQANETSEFLIFTGSYTPPSLPTSCEELTNIAMVRRGTGRSRPRQKLRLVGSQGHLQSGCVASYSLSFYDTVSMYSLFHKRKSSIYNLTFAADALKL